MTWQASVLRTLLKIQKKRRIRQTLSIPTVRRRLQFVERIVPGPPRGTETTALDADGIPATRVMVRQARNDRYVLYFHGGAYAIGSAALYRDFTWRISRAASAAVLFFEYRLAPEHPFPAALEDAVKVYDWLAGRCDPRTVAFAGDSAGGGLLFATLYKIREQGRALPAAAATISPWTDLALTGASLQANAKEDPMLDVPGLAAHARDYLAGADPRNPYASPLYGDVSGLPPALIQVGSDEILRDDAVRMAEKFEAAGCEADLEVWPQMPHAWPLYARILPEGERAIARLGEFLQRGFER
jgi:acetyl esterase/lipase